MPMPHKLKVFFNAPGMHVLTVDFQSVVAFITGFDSASEGSILVGFREWLIPKLDYGNSMAWPALFIQLTFRDADRPWTVPSNADQRILVKEFFATLEAFVEERDRENGLKQIFDRYDKWLRAQTWYRES